MPPTGRPTLCTPELIEQFQRYILEGATMQDAADLVGVSRSAACDWLARGLNGEAPFCNFSDAVTQARALAKHESIRAVRDGRLPGIGDKHDWKASALYLERQFPSEWGPQQAVTVKVEKELEKALDKLKEVLPADAYELALVALVGEAGGETPPVDSE
jgi:hypothetical protein